jgi:hypothetical protein
VDWSHVKPMLDDLHFRKIDLADEVFILNVAGYIGESTARELAYAESLGKPIRYLEDPTSPAPDELVRHCAKVYIQVLTGLDPSVHEIRHTEEAMRRALEHAAAWRGEGSE